MRTRDNMDSMPQLDDLHAQILTELADGRCTPRYLAGELGESRQLISGRLSDLIMADYAVKIDRGLYQITDDGRAEVSNDE